MFLSSRQTIYAVELTLTVFETPNQTIIAKLSVLDRDAIPR